MDTTVVHSTGEHFIAEEPVAENTAVRVWAIQALLAGYIYKVTKHGVHCVILLACTVQMSSMFRDIIISNHSLEKKEGIEILIFPAWCIIKDSDRRVDFFIITDHHKTWVKNGLLHVVHRQFACFWQTIEVLLNQVDKLLMGNGS